MHNGVIFRNFGPMFDEVALTKLKIGAIKIFLPYWKSFKKSDWKGNYLPHMPKLMPR